MLRAVNFWQGLHDFLVEVSLRVGNQNRLVHGAKHRQVRLAIAQADGGEAGSEAGAVELDQFAHGAAFCWKVRMAASLAPAKKNGSSKSRCLANSASRGPRPVF